MTAAVCSLQEVPVLESHPVPLAPPPLRPPQALQQVTFAVCLDCVLGVTARQPGGLQT